MSGQQINSCRAVLWETDSLKWTNLEPSCRMDNIYLHVTKVVGCMWVCKQEHSFTDMSAQCNIWFFNGHSILIEKPTNTFCLHNSCRSPFKKEESLVFSSKQLKCWKRRDTCRECHTPSNKLKLAFQIFQSSCQKMCEARREYFGIVSWFFFFLNLILNCCTSKNYEYKRINDNS